MKGRNKIFIILVVTILSVIYILFNSSYTPSIPSNIFTSDRFSTPKTLEPNVEFWRKIFTETSVYSIVYYTPGNYINIKQIDAKLDLSLSNDDLLNVMLVSDGDEIAKYSVFDLINDNTNVFNLSEVKEKIDEVYDNLNARLHANKTLKEDEHIGYSRGRKERLEKAWKYSGKFIKEVQQIFSEENVPEEIANLAFVESYFNPNALSENNALGIFQIIPSTARNYGLTVNNVIDERRDPLLEARATAKYLSKLHDEFGHWLWAINAYHSGEDNLRKALSWANKHYPDKPEEFHSSLRDYQYTKVVQEFPSDKEFNINTLKYGKRSAQYITLFLAFLESLDYFHKLNNFDLPMEGESIKIAYKNNYSLEKNIDIISGDTLSEISYSHGVSVEDIKEWNHLETSNIHAGKQLLLHIEKPPLTFNNISEKINLSNDEKEWIYEYNFSYRKSGDTLGSFLKIPIYSGSTINIPTDKVKEFKKILSNY